MKRSMFSQIPRELEVRLLRPRLVGQFFSGSEHVEFEDVALRPEIGCCAARRSGLLMCRAAVLNSVFPGIFDCSLWFIFKRFRMLF